MCATAGFADGKPAVMLIIFKQPQANIIDTVDRIRKALPSLKASAPKGMIDHHAGPDDHHSRLGA
jgi:multidrug efflux pump